MYLKVKINLEGPASWGAGGGGVREDLKVARLGVGLDIYGNR